MLFWISVKRYQGLLLALLLAAFQAGCGAYGTGNTGGNGSAPAAPTGFTAAAANAQVNLTWTASSGATSYYLKRSTTSGAEIQIAALSATTYADNSVTNGTKYFYVVSAYNSYGQSANSAEASATPVASRPPVAPTGLAAIAGNAQVALTWNATTGDTSYHVKRSTTNGSGYTQIAAPTAANYTDTGLTNGTTYYYVVPP